MNVVCHNGIATHVVNSLYFIRLPTMYGTVHAVRIETSGIHGTSSRRIMSSVRDLTDRFVNEWNEVNKQDGKCVE